MILDEKHECMPLDKLSELQGERLRAIAEFVYERVPHYKRVFDQKGLKPEDIRSLDDLRAIPFTYKNDLRDNYPFGMLAVPLSDVAEIHASSGTTGNPTVVAYTKNNVKLWSHVMARTIACAGGNSERHRPERLRIRAFHGRTGLSLRGYGAWGCGRSYFIRADETAIEADSGFRLDGSDVHSVIQPAHGRRGDGLRN